jgi:hypothetical protein
MVKDNIFIMMFFCWFESILIKSKGMLEVFKIDNRWSRCVDKLGQMKSRCLISQTIGSLCSVQRGEWFSDSLRK